VRECSCGEDGAGGELEEAAGMREGVAVCRLAWEEPLPPGGLRADVVVASDVLYDPEVVPVFVSLLGRLLGRRGGAREAEQEGGGSAGEAQEAYVASLLRNPATMELFLRTAAESGLKVEAMDGWNDTVRFHHVPALDDPTTAGRILLHRITAQ
ncbi:hypothetical protein Agub_g7215, partial [Astrephomene gubernaculifera]